jgi:hypothetical protein
MVLETYTRLTGSMYRRLVVQETAEGLSRCGRQSDSYTFEIRVFIGLQG